MEIINSTAADIDTIFKFYNYGTALQKRVAQRYWRGFERSMIETEIRESRQWKIIENGQVACIFAITFNDPFIWKEKDQDPSVYIHRIATHPSFRGNSYVKHIVAWAKGFAKSKGKSFIRMDTGCGNGKLNNYYVSCSFTYLGVFESEPSEELPAHYLVGPSSLFEIKLDNIEQQKLTS